MLTTPPTSLYEVLHVDRYASQSDISTSFRVLAAELHPDKGTFVCHTFFPS